MSTAAERFDLVLEKHPWRPAGPSDVRSPCPGLNILANHGFIARSGREITYDQLRLALQQAYNTSPLTARAFALLAIVIYGSLWSWTVSLDALAVRKTVRLEHPASLFHLDKDFTPPHGKKPARAYTTPYEPYVTQLLEITNDEKVDQHAVILHKLARERAENVELTAFAQRNAALEGVAVTQVWGGDKGYLTPAEVRSFVLEERLPDHWRPRTAEHTPLGTHKLVNKFMEEYEQAKKEQSR